MWRGNARLGTFKCGSARLPYIEACLSIGQVEPILQIATLGRGSVRNFPLRLSRGIVAVMGLWTLVWLPLVLSEGAAAEPQEQILGNPDAPVTIIEYASLTCPHCAQFHNEVLPELKERYITPGKVRLIYRDFPLDQVALSAAALAHCAGSDRYFSMLDVLFETQSNWARADNPITALKRLGKLGGLAEEEMEACLTDQKLTDGILQTRLAGQNQYDIGSTPTFVIDGKAYSGSRDVEGFSELLDPLLDQS
jgi:hypothetical protein